MEGQKTVLRPLSGLEGAPLPECLYLTENCRCTILAREGCAGGDCPFRRTGEVQGQAHAAWETRLQSLDSGSQAHIATQYYGGKTPWKQR